MSPLPSDTDSCAIVGLESRVELQPRWAGWTVRAAAHDDDIGLFLTGLTELVHGDAAALSSFLSAFLRRMPSGRPRHRLGTNWRWRYDDAAAGLRERRGALPW